jgi:alpha-methylacyl-CoA racemase
VSPLPLEGIRVLDLSRLLPGPFCSLLLADYGADVVKIEDTGTGDYLRWSVPAVEGVEDSAKAVRFLALNRNKASVRLNLKDPAGKEAFLRLVEGADVVLESFRPGVMDRLGLGYEALKARNPGVVLCATSGYGADGPLAARAGHDLNYLGRVGLLGLSGDADGPPVQAAGQIADIGGGALMAAFGILAALRERDRSGEGQLVDVSMADGALSWLAMDAARVLHGDTLRRGQVELGGRFVCYRPYQCADGWVTLGALEPKFFAAFCRGVGREDLVSSQFEAPGSDAHVRLQGVFMERTRAQWTRFAGEHDCCLEPVLELEEALESEHVRARGMVVELDQPGAQEPVRLLGPPVKLSRTPADPNRRAAPGLGEDTDAELTAAGLNAEELAALHAAGAAAGLPEPGAPGGSFLS